LDFFAKPGFSDACKTSCPGNEGAPNVLTLVDVARQKGSLKKKREDIKRIKGQRARERQSTNKYK
jgi:hypothetical protein